MRKNNKINSNKDDSLDKLIALYRKGEDVFGSKEAFNSWMSNPVFSLNSIPLQLIKTSYGIDLIDEELDRIAYGDVL